MKSAIKNIATLGKFTISLPVAFTAYIGYTLFSEQQSAEGLLAGLGIFFMSAGASGINQMQEVSRDRLMSRTSHRPLPKEHFTFGTAAAIIGLFLITGTILLLLFNVHAVFWGWMGLLWYNLVYTPLKTRTAFSVFPGAIVGAIPPIAGWVAAGGSIIDVRIHFLAFFFFLGQMPHFWLLVLKYKQQYKKAGFPVITDHLNNQQLFRINMIWSIATLVSVLFLPILNIITSQLIEIIVSLSVITMSIWVIASTYSLHQVHMKSLLKKQFIFFNSFYLWIMILLLIEQI
ncbi:UbiA family prenyltransferase [Carboxylicivirga sediminis]|uniref:heme o synthase n=1 Tax=Carboxylicivirga sediminis TaxID=2006564 RepID=A0A941FB00_9BACT|nr:UbiA family prenyltransferase [Carboxylicivirga sediminis]MBR8538045.1 UbiA family prenyltransferase [Carboxylicivirga sediminis]